MFLFIGESIGMQELILIGIFALIIFGPRKLPQMARTIGKVMAEFRRTTNQFKETWQKEVDFEEFKEDNEIKVISPTANSIAKIEEATQNQVIAPEIRELDQSDFEQKILINKTDNGGEKKAEESQLAKQNWL